MIYRLSAVRTSGLLYGVLIVVGLALAALIGFITGRVSDALLIGMVFLVMAFWILARRPAIAIAVLLSAFYFYPFIFDRVGWETSADITSAYYILLAASGYYFIFVTKRSVNWSLLRNPAVIALAGFLTWMIVNWLSFSANNPEAQLRMVYVPLTLIVPFSVAALSSDQQLDTTFRWVIGFGAVGILIGLLVYATGSGAVVGSLRFTISRSVNPLSFTYPLAIGALLLGARVMLSTSLRAWIAWAVYVGGVSFMILLTNTRGPLLALVVGVIVLVLLRRRISWQFVVVIVLVTVVLVSVVLPMVPSLGRFESIVTWIASVMSDEAADSTGLLMSASGGRENLWQMSILAWQSSPLLGIGPANLGSGTYSHNFALEILSELGLVGIVLFSVFVLFLLRAVIQVARCYPDRALRTTVLALLAFSLIHISFSGRIQLQVSFWFASGAIIALQMRIAVQNTLKTPPSGLRKQKPNMQRLEPLS